MELDAVSGLSNVGSCSTNDDTATKQEMDSCHQGYKMLLTNKLKMDHSLIPTVIEKVMYNPSLCF